MKHLRSLYWILAVAAMLIVTTVLTAPISDADVYIDMLKENGYVFANQTKDGQYREEQGIIDPKTGILTVRGLSKPDGRFVEWYEYQLVSDENGYRIWIPEYPPIPGGDGSSEISGYYPAGISQTIEPKLILSLLGGGKF
uniref:Uncharacterized protein n=1 Tax=Anopheles funestus TaxID=62324 RepID=A0A4Y0BCY0_ANOFN